MTEPKRLKDSQDLAELLTLSEEKPVLIFKHSSTCPISGAAMEQFQQLLKGEAGGPGGAATAWLVVQEDRPVSNEIAEVLGVKHESPQALVVRGGKAAWHASHYEVTAPAMAEAIQKTE